MRLTGKRAVVTGAARGIGRTTAEFFAREGARVILADIDRQVGQESAEAIRQAGGRADFLAVDVTDPDSVARLVEEAARSLGGIDVWMSNAGGSNTEDLLEAGPDAWQADVDLNLSSHYLCCKAVVPVMIDAGGGSIVTVSSVNAIWAIGEVGYSAAKAGLISLTRNIAVKYGPAGIRANVICPGTITTERCNEYWDRKAGAKEKLIGWYPLRRLGRPEDVAHLAVFLAADESSFMTAATLVLDGGLSVGTDRLGRD